jgi:hypothetical protein
MAPKESEHNGKMFRRCGVWVDDPFGEVTTDEQGNQVTNNGKLQRKRKNYQLIFEDKDNNLERAFRAIKPGRRIYVSGRLDDQPRVAPWDGKKTKKEIFTDPASGNKYVAYSNPKVYVEGIKFIDAPLKSTAERFVGALLEAGCINDDQLKIYTETIVNRLSNQDLPTKTTKDMVPLTDQEEDPFSN